MSLKIILCINMLVLSSYALATELRTQSVKTHEVTQSHLKSAYQAVFISRTSRAYNEIVPNLARRAKDQLIEQYPDLKNDISRIVDDVALQLADRQAELDLAISRNWAQRFSERELKEISAFYATPIGTKLAKQNTELIAAGLEEARKWGAEIGHDLIVGVREKLKASGHKL